MSPSIEVAAHAGVCYGVKRALEMVQHAAATSSRPVRTLGPLIHNPLVVKELADDGVRAVESPQELEGGTLVIRAHGVIPKVIEEAHARGLDVIDATCPFVKRVHTAAEKLCREGYQLIVVGECGHPEVEGIMGHANDRAHVVTSPEEVRQLELSQKVGVVVQTTQTAEQLSAVVAALLSRAAEVRVINTICNATSERQAAALELACRCDAMVVIGGRNSGNTRRLSLICQDVCANTHHIEQASELEAAWFAGCEHIGITAGASTPQEHIDRVVDAISEFFKA